MPMGGAAMGNDPPRAFPVSLSAKRRCAKAEAGPAAAAVARDMPKLCTRYRNNPAGSSRPASATAKGFNSRLTGEKIRK